MNKLNILFIFCLISFLGCKSKKEFGYPSLRIEPEAVDLGKFESGEGSSKFGQFKLVNQGTSSLIILGCETSCGCTIPSSIPVRIAPESSELLSFEVKAKNETGTHKSRITFRTNDPARPIRVGEILWIEKSAIYFENKSLDFFPPDMTSHTVKQINVFVSQAIDLNQLRI